MGISLTLAGCNLDINAVIRTPIPTISTTEPEIPVPDATPIPMPVTPVSGQTTSFESLPPCPENPLTPPPGPECRGRNVYTTTEDFISIPAIWVTRTMTPTITPVGIVTPEK